MSDAPGKMEEFNTTGMREDSSFNSPTNIQFLKTSLGKKKKKKEGYFCHISVFVYFVCLVFIIVLYLVEIHKKI